MMFAPTLSAMAILRNALVPPPWKYRSPHRTPVSIVRNGVTSSSKSKCRSRPATSLRGPEICSDMVRGAGIGDADSAVARIAP